MKKVYKKPTMCVVELHYKTNLLVCSDYNDDYDDEMGYIPGDTTDMNSMA